MQIWLHQSATTQNMISYRPLSTPFDSSIYRGLSMGSERLFSYLLAMRLQLHDNQAGKHIRYSQIDYELLVRWLDQIYRLNPASEYPIMLASRVYSQTRDKARLRIILDYINRTFMLDPQLHWRHLAEATVVAKHQLGDLSLALEMAEKLANQPPSVVMPAWARDIHLILLGDLNEYETAIAIIGELLNSDAVNDPDEKLFLQEKLLYFQQKLSEQ
jgi:tetratricopeptide (TPR) repeat protein